MSHLLNGDKYAFVSALIIPPHVVAVLESLELNHFFHVLQLKMKAPPAYVAGAGRGASGFTTRSDIGVAVSAEILPGKEELENDPDQFQDPDNETGLFAGTFTIA